MVADHYITERERIKSLHSEEEKKHLNFIQRPKLSKYMQFSEDVDIYMAGKELNSLWISEIFITV